MRPIKIALIALMIIVLVPTVACSFIGGGTIANTDEIFASIMYHNSIVVRLIPTDATQANMVYQVDLYENGKLRSTTTVSWNQPQINVKEAKLVIFPASEEEYDAYLWQDLSHIFSVKLHE